MNEYTTCSKCDRTDCEIVTVFKENWCVCHKCKLMEWIGYGIFHGNITEEESISNGKRLHGYEVVEIDDSGLATE